MTIASVLNVLLALLLAPLLSGVINRVKAVFAGRTGQPLLQPYHDLAKLLRKGAVYSRTTSWVFRLGPVAGLAAAAACLTILPIGGVPALLAFPGDLLLLAYLMGLMRFVTITAALDTGSAFEGMGASREAWYSMLAEPALILGLAALAVHTRSVSLSGMLDGLALGELAGPGGPLLVLVAGAFAIVLLAENARIPVDDPTTHLELTMIHEVMVLDHGGVDFGFIQYAAGLKLWVFSGLLTGVLLPPLTGWWPLDCAVGIALILAVAAAVGVVESVMARLKLVRVPQLLVAASVLSVLALALVLR
jgi:formate hydrogenlyase subunit 4